MFQRHLRLLSCLCLAALAVTVQTATHADAATVCRLAYTAKVHYAPQILALKKGWFSGPGVTVQGVDPGMSAGIAAAEALVSGSADVAVMGDVPAVFALASARPCVLIASYGGGENMHSIIVSASSGINTPRDLIGRRIGVHFGSSTHGAVYRYLQANNIDPAALTLVNVPQSSLVEALISGDIDALAASEPAPSLALDKASGSRLLSTLSGLGNEYPLMLVASRDFADAHPEVIRMLVAGTRKAVDYINADPEASGSEVGTVTGTPVRLEQSTLRRLTWQVRLDQGILESLEQTAEFLHKTGRLKQVLDIRKAARMEFVNK